ncbi:MAG: hypothetical protein JWM11_5267 [Planctomycetaceae bacterium]|nr:hypothetical protein [Planctomycetaceae bacterium]
MLLSRAFCLILGTTLFVLIWTMQDGNHRPTRIARSGRSHFVGPGIGAPPIRSTPARTTTVSHQPAVVQVAKPAAQKSAESLLWMFADELSTPQTTQIAGK